MRPLHGLLIALIVLGLTACQSFPGSGSGSQKLRKINASGELRVGLTGDQAPLNMKNGKGEVIGLEVDLIKALANAMGLEARFVQTPFAELIDALEQDRVDVVISGMTITPERNSRIAFAGPYFISGKSVLTKSELIAQVEDPKKLNDGQRIYAALAGSTSEEFVRDVFPKSRLVTTPDYETAIQMVIDDKVDALVADYQICTLSVWRHRDAGLLTNRTPFTVEPLGIGLPAGAPLLVNLVENYLDTLEHTGLLGQFKGKWLNDGDWIAELP